MLVIPGEKTFRHFASVLRCGARAIAVIGALIAAETGVDVRR